MSSRRPRRPLALGWEALRANIAPGLILQAAMLALVLAYYFSPTVTRLLNGLAEYKRAHGVVFVIGATVLAAAVLPEIFVVALFQRGRVRPENLRNLLFTAPLWAVDGISVDLLYRGLAGWLGDTASLPVVAAKICVDQFIYNVFFAAPYGVIAYQWKNSGYSSAVLRGSFSPAYYRDKVVPTLFATWAVWLPLVAMIYALPLALQFPLFSLALTFWVLLLTYMTNRFAGKSGRPEVVPIPAAPEYAP
ncbi:MAG: hypothetical protein ABI883_04950 [Chthoniobacterales bacterium]